MKEQYRMVATYCTQLMEHQSESTCFVNWEDSDRPGADSIFRRVYICLKPLIDGFHRGCRRIIGLDGCHTKEETKQQILTTVAADANNGFWPIAWAVVEKENYETWKWFLATLKENIQPYSESHYVMISNKQKGLERAIREIWPRTHHRNCVQHIYCNFKKLHKDQLWYIARCTNKEQWKRGIERLRVIDEPAYKWVVNHVGDPKHWCRAFFPTYVYSDMLCNNLSESFNAFILDARDKPIITMLEMIRSLVMERIAGRKLAISTKLGKVCPRIKKLLDENITMSIGFTHKFNGGHAFEVSGYSKQYVVDVKENSCSCGAWQLSGIPCAHSIPCLVATNRSPLDTVHSCYSIERFLRTYNHVLQPMDGMSQWPKDNMFPLQPPKIVKQPGRLKSSRNKPINEVVKVGKKVKMKKWAKMHCSWCGEGDHNVRTCKKKVAGVPKVNKKRSGTVDVAEPEIAHDQPVEHEHEQMQNVEEGLDEINLSTQLSNIIDGTPYRDIVKRQAANKGASTSNSKAKKQRKK